MQIILFVARLAARVDNYASFVIDYATGEHDCIDATTVPLRDVEVSADCLAKLRAGRAQVRAQFLHGDVSDLLDDYLRRLDDQTVNDPTNEQLIDRNSRLACDLHAHKLLLYRNVRAGALTPRAAKTLIGSFIYLTTRHTFNKCSRDRGAMLLPEFELYELLSVQRRRLVEYCASLPQGRLDDVMQTALQVSTSATGSLRASAEIVDAANRWSRIRGATSAGRFAVGSTRTVAEAEKDAGDGGGGSGGGNGGLETKAADTKASAAVASAASAGKKKAAAGTPRAVRLRRQKSFDATVGEVADTELLGVEMNVQIGQMTLRSRHLSALETDVANHPDVKLVFGDATMQASLLERAENRRRYRLVGLNHDLEHWFTPHLECPPLGDEWERDYDPSELFDGEKWVVGLFEPVRKAFFDGPNPPAMQFMLPERPLPDDAEVAVLLGLHQKIGGPFKLV